MMKPSFACRPLFEVDLHCHTTMSDGNDTPEELIQKAAGMGMRAIAIVDHDRVPVNVEKLKKSAKKTGLELVFGYEFSCDSYVDDVHIIGYELDWENPSVMEAEISAKNSKSFAYKELCNRLNALGLEISYEYEVLNFIDSMGNVRTRPPDEVQRKHIFELLAKKGYFPSWEKAKIFIRDDPNLNVRRQKIPPFSAIKVIKSCGGFSVLAHPYLIDEKLSSAHVDASDRSSYIESLIDHGLDGIESCYTYSKTTYKGKLTDKQIKDEVESLYSDRVRFFTGGSDYHNDAKKGVKNQREIGEAGMRFLDFKNIVNNIVKKNNAGI